MLTDTPSTDMGCTRLTAERIVKKVIVYSTAVGLEHSGVRTDGLRQWDWNIQESGLMAFLWNGRLVYDCTTESRQNEKIRVGESRGCMFCIGCCHERGRCIEDSQYEGTFCLGVLYASFWLASQLPRIIRVWLWKIHIIRILLLIMDYCWLFRPKIYCIDPVTGRPVKQSKKIICFEYCDLYINFSPCYDNQSYIDDKKYEETLSYFL